MVMATDADINIEHRLTEVEARAQSNTCLLYTSPSPRDTR